MLVGRDAERARIGALLEAAHSSRSGMLILRGEPGIGKTALLEDAREQAIDMHVLGARGLESESELAFAGLHQLVRPALHLVGELPGPQSAALQGALGLAERTGDDRFLISAGCLTLLAELAEERPVLCLVDDVQWLDTPSADALLFVARRLGAEGIAMIFTVRADDPGRFDARDLPSLELGGLDEAAAASLLGSRVDGALDEAVSAALVQHAHGNALALVELPAALTPNQLAGADPLPDALPLTRGVAELFLTRTQELSSESRQLLLLLAADDSGSLAPVLAAASALGVPTAALDAIEATGVVSVQGGRFELRHPLVRSAVYQAASSGERERAHRALAEAFDGELDADRRAWHSAAAALGTDDAVAAELEESAARAQQRAGHSAAAAALVRAAELSSDAGERCRRYHLAAAESNLAGHHDRAVQLAGSAAALTSDPVVQARLARLRGEAELWFGRPSETSDLLTAAARAVAEHDPGLAFELVAAAVEAGAIAGDRERMSRAVDTVTGLTPAPGDERQLLFSLMPRGGVQLYQGDLVAASVSYRRARALSAGEQPRDIVWSAIAAVLSGDYRAANALYDTAASRARQAGALGALVHVLSGQALCGLFFAHVTDAAATAHEAVRLADDLGVPEYATHAVGVLAWSSAILGREDELRGFSDQVRLTQSRGLAIPPASVAWGRAELALAQRRWTDALPELVALSAVRPGFGHVLIALGSTPGLVEAAVRLGRPELAAAGVERVESWVGNADAHLVQPLLERSLALLADSTADADLRYERALDAHEDGVSSYSRARMQLLYGEHLRRQRRRADARKHLRMALETFETLGAEPWAQRARAELRASGESARRRDPSTAADLTPQELQIARLVGEGLSNKEVAAQLFLSPRTIDYHLRHVFAKLGITSRTQLAGIALGGREPREAVTA